MSDTELLQSLLEYTMANNELLARLNGLGDIFLAGCIAVLFCYMFYNVLLWFSRF